MRPATLLMVAMSCGCSSDVFHDTSWKTACELDPQLEGCPEAADAGDAGAEADAGAGDAGVSE